MKLQQILTLLFLSSALLIADHNYNQLIIPSVNIENPYWEFAYQTISQKEDGAFERLVEKWENIVDTKWQKLNEAVYEEIGINADQLCYYLSDQDFIDAYIHCYKAWYEDFIDEKYPQYFDPIVLNFIHLKLYYLGCGKPTQINRLDDIPMLTTSFGSDSNRHYLIVNEHIYNKDNMQVLYGLTEKKIVKYQIIPHTNFHKSLAIEYANLLHLGIVQSLSNIVHQSDFFIKLLQVIIYSKKTLSEKTQKYGSDHLIFISFLESALQSKNPVEIALFLEPQLDNLHFEFATLWQEFIQDLQNCYDADDLEKYETLSRDQRREILYQDQEEK